MSNTANPIKKEQMNGSENHKTAAMHHEQAAKHHTDAANHIDAGDDDKAAKSTVKAQGHHVLANEANKEVSKNHVSKK